jgi:hypothetical protein
MHPKCLQQTVCIYFRENLWGLGGKDKGFYILESIKQMFPHKLVEINIQSVDETDFILSNPAYANELKERIENYEKGQKVISLKAEEIL